MSEHNDFLKRLSETFKVEAKEHIAAITAGLINLEKTSTAEEQTEIIETIHREAHSLKGAARSVDMREIEKICQSMENVFAGLKTKDVLLSQDMYDILHRAVDTLSKLLLSAEAENPKIEEYKIKDLIQQLDLVSKGSKSLPKQAELKKEIHAEPEQETYKPSSEEKPASTETIRISASKLDSLLLQAEELLSAKLSADQLCKDFREINEALVLWEKEQGKIPPEARRIQQIFENKGKRDSQPIKLLDFLDWNYTYIKSLAGKLAMLANSAESNHHSLCVMVDNLQQDIKKVLIFPFSSLLEIFPKIVRDLTRDQGKEAELVIRGGETEVDRRILEEIKDPLIHLVRNCVDHGIEKPEERVLRKKPPTGTITVAISQVNSSKVEILFSDDGKGIDLKKIKEAAVRTGVILQEEAEKMNEQEVLALIFQSGVSTSPIITDISGRGLGLAIVREKVEKLGGIVSCESKPNVGTTLQVILPMTLATFRGVLIRLNEHLFVLPTTNVDRIVRIKHDEIKTIENKETISLNGRTIPLVPFHIVLELPQKENKAEGHEFVTVLVLGTAEKRIAFSVDEVLNEQEVMVKSLGSQLSRVRNIAGATVLGTGKVVPILNVTDLMKSAVKVSAAPAMATVAAPEEIREKKSVLVVEDSITARTLLKNILETSGFDVKTAVDGIDAFTVLKTGDFDLVVSDVDMPRMNGFDLTTKIRSDKKFADLPVVLVTALESREDREHGIEVGADAYIVKSSFDQSNLLEVIKRLI
jgi:two-component system chemotaxis sensor kinase CheA